MGQYHYPVNWDRKEYLDPNTFGDGLKLLEFGSSANGTLTGLAVLLASSNQGGARGGGDLHPWHGGPGYGGRENEVIVNARYEQALMECIVGRWATDRVSILGDYHTTEEIPADVATAPWTSGPFTPEPGKGEDQLEPWGHPLYGAENHYWLELERAQLVNKSQEVWYASDRSWSDISDVVVQTICLDYYTRSARFTPKEGEHTGVFGNMPGPLNQRLMTLDGRIPSQPERKLF
jgi:hypothetical protein